MKAKWDVVGLRVALILSAGLGGFVCTGSAQTPESNVDIGIAPGTVLCVDEQATFSAQHNCTVAPAGTVSYQWSGAFSHNGQTANQSFSTPGAKSVTVDVTYTTVEGGDYHGQASRDFVVVKMVSITPSAQTVCLGEERDFQVTTEPAGRYERVTVSAQGATLLSFDQSTGVARVRFDQLSSSNSDDKTVSATCGNTVTALALIVKVASISPSGETVCVNTERELQVETSPPGNYHVASVSTGGGVSVVTPYNPNTGKIKVRFDQASLTDQDYKTVTASCGQSPETSSTLVVRVASIEAECTQVGVGCTVALTAHTEPPGRAVNFSFPGGGAGTGGSQLEYTGDQTASFIAGNQNLGVTVTACDSELAGCCAAVGLTVVGACDQNAASSPSFTEIPETDPALANCGGNLGFFSPEMPTVDATACIDVGSQICRWRLRVNSVSDTYSLGVCLQGLVDVVADAPQITTNNVCAIIAALNPPPTLSIYGSLECFRQHENTHLAEWVATFNAVWPQYEAQIENLAVSFACGTAETPEAAVQLLEAQKDQLVDGFVQTVVSQCPSHANGLTQADNVTAECLLELVGAIETRATNEQWCAQPCILQGCPP
jgi:hypothetical protein